MSIHPLLDVKGPRTSSHHRAGGLSSILDHSYPAQPHTPPESDSGSPRAKFERISLQHCSPRPDIICISTPRHIIQCKLPSLEEFDQGVEALARTHGPASRSWTPPSPLSSIGRQSSFQPLTPTSSNWSLQDHPFDEQPWDYSTSRRGPISNQNQYALAADQAAAAFQENFHKYQLNNPALAAHINGMYGYPSPPPEGENRHINQKYTTEEGDFIIYAWHDKKMKWQRIKQEFASMFGRTPERTVQGLQAWYYRMNQRIPIWDQDGWLVFDNEDDLEPKQISIKCRERDGQDKPMEPLGLAQRYPERAINYHWVDPELKHKSRDWAAKRASQYRERRERRKRKEQRRMKL